MAGNKSHLNHLRAAQEQGGGHVLAEKEDMIFMCALSRIYASVLFHKWCYESVKERAKSKNKMIYINSIYFMNTLYLA